MDFGCDEIKCINIQTRNDKRELFSKMMSSENIDFEYFNAIVDKNNPSRGCFKSHAKIISDAYENGTKRLMVFEDDALLNKQISLENVDEIRKFLDNEDWDIFFLGGFPEIMLYEIKKHHMYNNIYKGTFLCAAAYILNEKSIKKLKNLEWGGNTKVIDKDIFMNFDKSYAILPQMYGQRIISNDLNYLFNNSKNSYFIRIREIIINLQIWYSLHINIKFLKLLLLVIIFVILLVKIN